MMMLLEAAYEYLLGQRPSSKKFIAAICLLVLLVLLLPEAMNIGRNGLLSGEWNIAIAEFSTEAKSISRDEAFLITEQFARKLEGEIHDSGNLLSIVVAGPSEVGFISPPSNRITFYSIGNVAKRLNAQVLLYGKIVEQNNVAYLIPSVYLSTENAYELDDLVGDFQLGAPIPIIGSEQDTIPSQIELNLEFTNRAALISDLAQGIGDFFYANYSGAIDHFTRANSDEYWPQDKGRELVYLLLGNAAIRQGDWVLAETALQRALAINPGYSRAMISLGGLRYTQSMKDASQENFLVDEDLIQEAIDWHLRAQQANTNPFRANIEAKINFGLGQLFLLQYLQGHSTAEAAVEAFNQVIIEYERTQDAQIAHIASEAYGRMAVLYSEEKYYETAIQLIEKAIRLSQINIRTGLFWATKSDLYLRLHENEQAASACLEARAHYQKAIAVTRQQQAASTYWKQIARCFIKTDQLTEAIDAYREAYSLVSPNPEESREYQNLIATENATRDQ